MTTDDLYLTNLDWFLSLNKLFFLNFFNYIFTQSDICMVRQIKPIIKYIDAYKFLIIYF